MDKEDAEMLAEYAGAAELNCAFAEEHMEAFWESLERSLEENKEVWKKLADS